MSTTIVPPTRASASQSVSSSSPNRRCPVTMVTLADIPRCVTGTPAAAGAAIAEVMPGTTSNGTPAACSAACLLAAPAEEERIAALQPYHAPMALRELRRVGR